MKLLKIAIFSLTLLLGYSTIAQDEPKQEEDEPKQEKEFVKDTIEFGHLEIVVKYDQIKKGKEEMGHIPNLEIGMNTLITPSYERSFDNAPFLKNETAKSLRWAMNSDLFDINLIGRSVRLSTALGIRFDNITMNSNYVLNNSADSLTATKDTIDYRKNKLLGFYGQLPVQLEFNLSKKKTRNVFFAFGVTPGIRIGSHYKLKGIPDEGRKFKSKVRDDFHLNPFTCDITARIGYKETSVFAAYNIIPVFDTNAVIQDTHTFTVGLGFEL